MEELNQNNENVQRKPLGLVLLGGLYLFFFMLSISSFGYPFPFMGDIHQGRTAEMLVFGDSLVCLYLFLGVMKQQKLTWYLLIGYNIFEIINTLVNLLFIPTSALNKIVGEPIDPQRLAFNNFSVMVAIIFLTAFICRHRGYFTNRSKYLF